LTFRVLFLGFTEENDDDDEDDDDERDDESDEERKEGEEENDDNEEDSEESEEEEDSKVCGSKCMWSVLYFIISSLIVLSTGGLLFVNDVNPCSFGTNSTQ